jgi:multiple sugar transport system permease protein
MKVNDRTYVLLLLAPAAAYLLIFVAYPLVMLVWNSLHEVELLRPAERTFIGLANYADALTSERVLGSAWRTLLYSAMALTAEFILGFAVALLFNAFGKRSELARAIFIFPLMIPPIVAGLLWRYILIDNFGIVNWLLTWAGILDSPGQIAWLSDERIVLFSVALPDIWLTTSFVALVLYTGLQNIPPELIEASKIDGANAVQAFWNVTLPLLRPVIAVVLIIRGIDVARAFDVIWIQTEGGPRFASEVLSMHIYRTMIRYGDMGFASAIAVLFLIALLAVSMVAFYSVWRPGLSGR